MKKILFTLLILIFVFPAFAQDTNKNTFVLPEMGDKVKLPDDLPVTAEEYYDYAEKLWRKTYGKEKNKVLEYLNKAIELKPDFAEAFYLRGFVKNRIGKYQESIEDFTRTLQLAPDKIRAYEYLAESKKELKDYKGALAELDNFITQFAAQGYHTLGSLQERGKLKYILGDYDGAIQDFTKAISLNRSSDPYFYRAAVYMKKGEKSSALQDFKILAETYDRFYQEMREKYPDLYQEREGYPDDENPLETLKKKETRSGGGGVRVGTIALSTSDASSDGGRVYNSPTLEEKLVLENWFVSEKDFSSFGLGDGQIIAFYHYGLLLAEQGELDEAEEAFTKSLRYELGGSDNFDAWFQRGKIRLTNKQFEPAVRDFSWAISKNKNLSDAYLERGIAILMLGHDQLAQKDFDKYLKLNPKGKEILQSKIEKAKKLRAELNKAK